MKHRAWMEMVLDGIWLGTTVGMLASGIVVLRQEVGRCGEAGRHAAAVAIAERRLSGALVDACATKGAPLVLAVTE
jgi:hypothetical protein